MPPCKCDCPAPAEPVNAQLLKALKAIVQSANMNLAAVNQFLLIDACEVIAVAESAPKTVLLSDEDFFQEIEGAGIPVEDVALACAIKDLVQFAVLAKNGIEVAE